MVNVRLLGDFELTVDGQPTTAWHGQLGPTLMKFLLAQPNRRAHATSCWSSSGRASSPM
jgi:hypothetical protein